MGTNELTDTTVDGTLEVEGTGGVDGNFTVNSPNFVAETFGPVLVAGDLTVTGAMTIDDAVSLDDVGQIEFPATQDPSAGVNVLDDYEEGTFTPHYKFGGASVDLQEYNHDTSYTKIGNCVFIRADNVLDIQGSSTGNMTITGLPFVSTDTAYNIVVSSSRFCQMDSKDGTILTVLNPDTALLEVMSYPDNGGTAVNLDDTDTTAWESYPTYWCGTFAYFV